MTVFPRLTVFNVFIATLRPVMLICKTRGLDILCRKGTVPIISDPDGGIGLGRKIRPP